MMMVYILISFAVGFEGGMIEPRGDDIVSAEFGSYFGFFCDFDVTPNLNYGLSFGRGRAPASTRTMAFTYDSLGQQHFFSAVRGEDFGYYSGDFSVKWMPFMTALSPYLSGRLGFKKWEFVSGGEVVTSLNGNEFEGLSLSLSLIHI